MTNQPRSRTDEPMSGCPTNSGTTRELSTTRAHCEIPALSLAVGVIAVRTNAQQDGFPSPREIGKCDQTPLRSGERARL